MLNKELLTPTKEPIEHGVFVSGCSPYGDIVYVNGVACPVQNEEIVRTKVSDTPLQQTKVEFGVHSSNQVLMDASIQTLDGPEPTGFSHSEWPSQFVIGDGYSPPPTEPSTWEVYVVLDLL